MLAKMRNRGRAPDKRKPADARQADDTVSEWLRRWTRNPLGFARRGSNPLGVGFGSRWWPARVRCERTSPTPRENHTIMNYSSSWFQRGQASLLLLGESCFPNSSPGSHPKTMRCPGIEPGPSVWKADILTTRPTTLTFLPAAAAAGNVCKNEESRKSA